MQHKKGNLFYKPVLSSFIDINVFKKLFSFLLFSFFIVGCHLKTNQISEMNLIAERRVVNEKYPKIPKEEILQQGTANRTYIELQERYKASLAAFKTLAEVDCAKIVVVILTPEVGKATTLANTFGIPYILESCSSLNIDCIDLTPQIATNDLNDITLLPEDIHWSKNGSVYVANLLTNIILKYNNIRNTKTYPDTVRPKIFGDLPPNDNEVLDGEMNLPYRQKTNAQGLRMDHNLTFPKKKQTILLMGNSYIYQPYLDNEFIITSLLQNRFPDKEIINAGKEKYTMEDHLSLYAEKMKYTEPDLIIICTDGNDILNYYFSQRNHFSRLRKVYQPTSVEKTFYTEIFNNSSTNQ